MSLDHQVSVLMKKTQMSGERAGSQCGLTSLLPMSCRGRAAAFARDLHTRLRSLGAGADDDGDVESSWLAKDALRHRSSPEATSPKARDADTFYDFELECESPSSPFDEFEPTFEIRSPVSEEPPFYDVDPDPNTNRLTKLQQVGKAKSNGFRLLTSFYTDTSPVKTQPVPRENGHDGCLYQPITFEDCARTNSLDEIDCVLKPKPIDDSLRLQLPLTSLDSDSDFESAKSDPSDGINEKFENGKIDNDISECTESLSLAENEAVIEKIEPVYEEIEAVVAEIDVIKTVNEEEELNRSLNGTCLEIITTEEPIEKEISPEPEIDDTLLTAEITTTDNAEHEIEDDRPQRVRRCSSLKTGKTPPGTPGRKKIVRFADVLGLDLADVKTFMDEIPVIPKSAYDDLVDCDIMQCSAPARAQRRLGTLTLVPLFQVSRDVTEKLETQNVCLETALVGEGPHITVCGSARVRNLDFHKTVHIRYTMDRWKTYTDLQTTYVPGSCDGYSDRFQFVLYAPCISAGQRLELAVRFQCKGCQYWDNNSGANYCFDCLALGVSPVQLSGPLHPTVDWHPSFY